MTEWIDLKNDKPNVDKTDSSVESVTVIACNEEEEVMPLVYARSIVRGKKVYRWRTAQFRLYEGAPITHWMPLPKPPKPTK